MDSGFFVKENMAAPLGRPPFTVGSEEHEDLQDEHTSIQIVSLLGCMNMLSKENLCQTN